MVDSIVPTSGPWSLLGQYMSYIIKLAPILWWTLPAGSVQPHPKPPNASTYAWLPDRVGRCGEIDDKAAIVAYHPQEDLDISFTRGHLHLLDGLNLERIKMESILTDDEPQGL
ncbi:hypothetical protein DSO57_1021220 [Entomophthora muscae]|uniref:Uncharacterized protein n=1 Tax=Entomophthora muscae TaxID=34485 RepID=A0ACC2TE87_9FUNG|nr:hypothetical protein DSO57_1021220 [Entomophthora muscae]